MSYSDKISNKLADQLPSPAIAAVHVMPPGGLKSTTKVAGGAAVGGVVGAVLMHKAQAKQREQVAETSEVLPAAAQMGLALTADSLISLENSAMTNGPKRVLGTLALSSVLSVTSGEGKHMGMKMGFVTVTLRDGRSLSFEVARAHMKEAEAFIEAAQPLLARASEAA